MKSTDLPLSKPNILETYKYFDITDIKVKDISVDIVTYLMEEEIEKRITLSTKAYYANLKFFKNRFVTKYSKLELYRTVIRPIVIYASETWVLKETVIQKLLVS
jgi:uncharacterized Fe-S radical SAM superfamily protein PflX